MVDVPGSVLTFQRVDGVAYVNVPSLTSWLRKQALLVPDSVIRDTLAEVANLVEGAAGK